MSLFSFAIQGFRAIAEGVPPQVISSWSLKFKFLEVLEEFQWSKSIIAAKMMKFLLIISSLMMFYFINL